MTGPTLTPGCAAGPFDRSINGGGRGGGGGGGEGGRSLLCPYNMSLDPALYRLVGGADYSPMVLWPPATNTSDAQHCRIENIVQHPRLAKFMRHLGTTHVSFTPAPMTPNRTPGSELLSRRTLHPALLWNHPVNQAISARTSPASDGTSTAAATVRCLHHPGLPPPANILSFGTMPNPFVQAIGAACQSQHVAATAKPLTFADMLVDDGDDENGEGADLSPEL